MYRNAISAKISLHALLDVTRYQLVCGVIQSIEWSNDMINLGAKCNKKKHI